ncbi:HEAT repeat domain-containing protein [Salmonella enterica subsp. enterica]|uniref:HEAT repeat domain-containing protein n=1 Tax=Salmonella enterica TaxID=28901 RepID=UPI002151176E|nr:HEAT repeat domain-containing protein [Salmonella enterica]MCR6026774.1 HEAT repeat domain-containing protein [Salmonella enterica subsp. enterica]
MKSAVKDRLLTLTRDGNHEVRLSAIYALGEGGDPTSDCVDRLLDLSKDGNHEIRLAAIKALGRISRES